MYLDWGYVFFWIGGLLFVGGALVYGLRNRSPRVEKEPTQVPPPPPSATPPSITRRAIK
jgi:hypothetical protein